MTKTQNISLLILLINFEKYWIAYYISDGSLFYSDVRREAKLLVDYYYSTVPEKSAPSKRTKIEKREDTILRQLVESLSEWLRTDQIFPSQSDKSYVSISNNYVLTSLSELENYLCHSLSLPINVFLRDDDIEEHIHERILRWSGQFPDTVVPRVNDQFINNMSQTESLILVADIRHSQDLMTYGINPDYYREKIIAFIDYVRAILKEHFAIYDRFTGDGFIAYFNEYLCDQEGKDYYQMMLMACKKIVDFSNDFFPTWKKCLRKIPNEEVGLSMGIDSGRVSYKDIKNQLFAIGDACVWATRMSSVGKAGEIILNNLPYQHLVESRFLDKNVNHPFVAQSKNGEQFTAFRLDLNTVNYVSDGERTSFSEKPGVID